MIFVSFNSIPGDYRGIPSEKARALIVACNQCHELLEIPRQTIIEFEKRNGILKELGIKDPFFYRDRSTAGHMSHTTRNIVVNGIRESGVPVDAEIARCGQCYYRDGRSEVRIATMLGDIGRPVPWYGYE